MIAFTIVRYRRRLTRAWLWLALLAFAPPVGARDAEPGGRILILLNSIDLGAWEQAFLRSYQQELENHPDVWITIEFLGLDYFDESRYRELASLISRKHASNSFDLVVSVLPQAVDFLVRHGDLIHPEATRLYIAPSLPQQQALQNDPRAMVLPSAWDDALARTVDIAGKLFPDRNRLLVVAGAGGEDGHYLQRSRKLLNDLVTDLDIDYSVGESAGKIAARVTDHTLILLLSHEKDETGLHHTVHMPPALNAVASAPVFGLFSDLVGVGVVGGAVTSTRAYGRVSARMSLEYLARGSTAVTIDSPVEVMFDAAQLDRFSIGTGALPATATVLNQERTLWQTYRTQLLTILAVIVIQLLLIVLLARSRLAQAATARRLQQNLDALEHQTQLFRGVIDAIPDAIFLLDADGTIITANHPGLRNVFNVSAEAAVGHAVDTIGMSQDQLREAHAGSDGFHRLRRLDGTEIVAEVTRIPLTDPSGSDAGTLFFVGDRTERVRQDQELRRSQKMDALGQLAGGIAHDFNNLLAVILGNAELAMLDRDDPGKLDASLTRILSATGSARDLVKQILGFSRDSASDARNVFDLSRLMRETRELIRVSIPSSIAFELEVDDDLQIVGDRAQIQSVVINLVTNSSHAINEHGTIRVSTSRRRISQPQSVYSGTLSPGAWAVLEVADNGSGISEHIMERMFEPFFTTKPPGEGSGMGLAMVYGVVTAHGGQLDVASTEGQGATFSLFLPLCERTDHTPGSSDRTGFDGGGSRVLLVDDDEAVLATERRLLETLGFEVHACSDARAALAAFTTHPEDYDLLITDQTMPHMMGSALVRRVRAVNPTLPVFIATGMGSTLSGLDCNILRKPFSLAELTATFAELDHD